MLYDCDGERVKYILSDANFHTDDVLVSPNGRWCAATGRQSINYAELAGVNIWDLDTGTLVGDRGGNPDSSECLALMPNGRQFLSGCSDGTAKLWDFAEGCVLATLEGHSAPVTCIDVSADERFVVTAYSDRAVRAWELRSGKCVATYRTPGGDVEKIMVRYPFLVIACKNGLLDLVELMHGDHVVGTDIPLATAFRTYHMGIKGQPGKFDRDLSALCPWCGRIIAVLAEPERLSWLQILRGIKARPSLMLIHLGKSAKCPYTDCARPLTLNAFVYDGLCEAKQSAPPEVTADTETIGDLLRVDNSWSSVSNDVRAFLARGARWETMNRWSDAIRCYSIGLETCGRDPELLFRLGTALARDLTQLEAAREALEEALKGQPGRGDLIHNLGIVLILLGRNVEAVAASDSNDLAARGLTLLEQATALDENYNLAEILRRLGIRTTRR
jgi:hypothetical protein